MMMSILEIRQVLKYLHIECDLDDVNISGSVSNGFDVFCNDQFVFEYVTLPVWHNNVVTGTRVITYKQGDKLERIYLDDILKKS